MNIIQVIKSISTRIIASILFTCFFFSNFTVRGVSKDFTTSDSFSEIVSVSSLVSSPNDKSTLPEQTPLSPTETEETETEKKEDLEKISVYFSSNTSQELTTTSKAYCGHLVKQHSFHASPTPLFILYHQLKTHLQA